MWTLLVLVITLVVAAVKFVKQKYQYWADLGVPSPKPRFIFGNIGESLNNTKNLGEIYNEIYNDYKDVPYVGYYKLLQPAVVLRDPELVRDVFSKDFNHFEANDIVAAEMNCEITERNLFGQTGHRWKALRGLISPNFTNAKMKLIFPLVAEINEKFTNYIRANCKGVTDVKDVAVKYTTESVASCAFGLEGRAFEPKQSEFVHITKQLEDLPAIEFVKASIVSVLPFLKKMIGITFFNREVTEYLLSVVTQAVHFRESNAFKRNDFLDMLIAIKGNKEYTFTNVDVTALAAGFFGDGVETSSIVVAYTLYELAENEDVQEKVYHEIMDTIEKHGELNYDVLQEMTYLDCVVTESLRKHPPFLFSLKRCTKEYEMPPIRPDSDKKIILKENTSVIIPIDAIQSDEKYFPEPEKFIPDRFARENKDSLRRSTFLAFGEGPRICVGMKFGLLQVKMAILAAVKDFKLEKSEKTNRPLKFDSTKFMRIPKGGIWLTFVPRT